MLCPSDAPGSAPTAVSEEEWGYADLKASTPEILEDLRKEANEQFGRYKQELGISA
jgi:hypothetical protein